MWFLSGHLVFYIEMVYVCLYDVDLNRLKLLFPESSSLFWQKFALLTGVTKSGCKQSVPPYLIRAFEKWCICEQSKVLPKSPIGKAIGYFLNYSRQLVRYTMDGRYMLDNNLIENSVPPVALGRKNYHLRIFKK